MTTTLFDIAADCLESNTDMDRLTARGTLRLALKEAGLEIQNLSVQQLHAVFAKLMPAALEVRGIANAAALCGVAIEQIAIAASTADLTKASSPDEIFRRLGGG